MTELTIRVDSGRLEQHIKRICRRNLKVPCKICLECPILPTVIDIMNQKGWGYHKQIDQTLKNYNL